jgi:hypothetical protein
MSNITAMKLGRIAAKVGDPRHPEVGDNIDRGLILIKELKAAGYSVVKD